jgi:hypothetical protein
MPTKHVVYVAQKYQITPSNDDCEQILPLITSLTPHLK